MLTPKKIIRDRDKIHTMDKKQISQKEYLKKYLSSGKDKKKVKKKKPNLGSKTVKIIDDDIDLKNMRAIEDGEFDIYANTEDGPQIAGIVDERGPVDFSDKKRWKIITDDGYGDISVTSVNRDERIPNESSSGVKAASYPAKDRSQSPNSDHSPLRKSKKKSSTKNIQKSASEDEDFSPPRRSRKNSDSDELPRKKSSRKRQQSASGPAPNDSGTEDSDLSLPRKSKKDVGTAEPRRKKSSKKKNRSGSENNDFSPPRRSEKNSVAEESRRKTSSLKKRHRSASSLVQNNSASENSDLSPPRKSRKDPHVEDLRRKKTSSKKSRSGSEDSDFSPPRKNKKNSESDLSPPRNPKSREKEREEYRNRDEFNSNSQKKFKHKYDKERENSARDSRRRNYGDRNPRNRSSRSPSGQGTDFNGDSSLSRGRNDFYRSERYGNGNSYSDHKNNHRTREDRGSKRERNRKETETLPRNKRRTNSDGKGTNSHSGRAVNDSESDLSPPRENKRKSKRMEPESSPRGMKNRIKSRNSEAESSLPQKTAFRNYEEMTEETSGFGQAPVLRDRKTGRRRDLAAEAREQEEKDEKRQELEEKYAQWGRGLKQVEDREEKLNRDLYEMTKPLARYADDADLERELKAQEREGDPMLAYMKRKHKKEGKQEPETPKYNGPSMPNRFGIRPGYRWDGVDRSNGYEKKWFDAQNARKAVQEEAYKWSTADM